MHEVQTVNFVGVPLMVVRTVCTLGFHRREVRRCEWEIRLPKPGPLPQTSHLAATGNSPRWDLDGTWMNWMERDEPESTWNNRGRISDGGGRPQIPG